MSIEFCHQAVMLAEVTEVLRDLPSGVVVDATLGGGAHSEALLNANENLQIIGFDRDQDALTAARNRLSHHGERFIGVHQEFQHITEVLANFGHQGAAGCLFDLGVSSYQLDNPQRGFSFRHNGPLDMRMDPSMQLTAADVVNNYDRAVLKDLLWRNAGEKNAQRISAAIIAARPITTTQELAETISDALPAAVKRRKGHPARRTFQAIRIEVNQELTHLESAVKQALSLLVPQGRCAVLAYHSGEDRIIKRCFREAANAPTPKRYALPPDPKKTATVRLLWSGARKPDAAEIVRNPRCTAARMRAVEKLETDT